MSAGKRILVGGGVRSGKSAFAVEAARRLGRRRVYVATAEAGDGEMSERILRHRGERGSDFETLEAPVEVVDAVGRAAAAEVVVLDCLTLWLANLLLAGWDESRILQEVDRLIEAVRPRSFHFIAVTNEVGMGVVPESPLGRSFRDVCGRAHQRFGAAADEVYFGAMGMILRLKPGPIEAVDEKN